MKSILSDLRINDFSHGACSGINKWSTTNQDEIIESINPSTGEVIASVYQASERDYDRIVQDSVSAFKDFRKVPAPIFGKPVLFKSLFPIRFGKVAPLLIKRAKPLATYNIPSVAIKGATLNLVITNPFIQPNKKPIKILIKTITHISK